MNAERRKALNSVIDKINDAMSELEGLRDEEEEYKDNMPENMHGSERYENAESAVSNMQEAYDQLEDAVSKIEEACE